MPLIGKTVEEQVWNFFMPKIGNAYGVCAIMGNWQIESGMDTKNMQNSYEKRLGFTDETYTAAVDGGSYRNFIRDSVGYGLAQWTYWSRKQGLLDYAKNKKRSVSDTETQLEFAWHELTTGYRSVLAVMKSAKTVREASDVIVVQYERPADQSEAAKKRRAECGLMFYEKYAGKKSDATPAPPHISDLEAAQKPAAAASICHVVKKGDTLYSLAKKYDTSVNALVQLNGIANPNKIYIGQKIRVK